MIPYIMMKNGNVHHHNQSSAEYIVFKEVAVTLKIQPTLPRWLYCSSSLHNGHYFDYGKCGREATTHWILLRQLSLSMVIICFKIVLDMFFPSFFLLMADLQKPISVQAMLIAEKRTCYHIVLSERSLSTKY